MIAKTTRGGGEHLPWVVQDTDLLLGSLVTVEPPEVIEGEDVDPPPPTGVVPPLLLPAELLVPWLDGGLAVLMSRLVTAGKTKI